MKGRARHAKVFLAMMQILDQKAKPEARLLDLSANSRMADEQYALTRGKYEKITRKYFREDGTLLPFTLKARERVALPRKIVEPFGQGVRYSKKELNTLLAKIAEDYVLVRRCLVDHGFVSCRADDPPVSNFLPTGSRQPIWLLSPQLPDTCRRDRRPL